MTQKCNLRDLNLKRIPYEKTSSILLTSMKGKIENFIETSRLVKYNWKQMVD